MSDKCGYHIGEQCHMKNPHISWEKCTGERNCKYDSPSPSPGGCDEYKLPCDVRLPPATTIKKGCKLSTLMEALKVRERFPSVEFRNSGNSREG